MRSAVQGTCTMFHRQYYATFHLIIILCMTGFMIQIHAQQYSHRSILDANGREKFISNYSTRTYPSPFSLYVYHNRNRRHSTDHQRLILSYNTHNLNDEIDYEDRNEITSEIPISHDATSTSKSTWKANRSSQFIPYRRPDGSPYLARKTNFSSTKFNRTKVLANRRHIHSKLSQSNTTKDPSFGNNGEAFKQHLNGVKIIESSDVTSYDPMKRGNSLLMNDDNSQERSGLDAAYSPVTYKRRRNQAQNKEAVRMNIYDNNALGRRSYRIDQLRETSENFRSSRATTSIPPSRYSARPIRRFFLEMGQIESAPEVASNVNTSESRGKAIDSGSSFSYHDSVARSNQTYSLLAYNSSVPVNDAAIQVEEKSLESHIVQPKAEFVESNRNNLQQFPIPNGEEIVITTLASQYEEKSHLNGVTPINDIASDSLNSQENSDGSYIVGKLSESEESNTYQQRVQGPPAILYSPQPSYQSNTLSYQNLKRIRLPMIPNDAYVTTNYRIPDITSSAETSEFHQQTETPLQPSEPENICHECQTDEFQPQTLNTPFLKGYGERIENAYFAAPPAQPPPSFTTDSDSFISPTVQNFVTSRSTSPSNGGYVVVEKIQPPSIDSLTSTGTPQRALTDSSTSAPKEMRKTSPCIASTTPSGFNYQERGSPPQFTRDLHPATSTSSVYKTNEIEQYEPCTTTSKHSTKLYEQYESTSLTSGTKEPYRASGVTVEVTLSSLITRVPYSEVSSFATLPPGILRSTIEPKTLQTEQVSSAESTLAKFLFPSIQTPQAITLPYSPLPLPEITLLTTVAPTTNLATRSELETTRSTTVLSRMVPNRIRGKALVVCAEDGINFRIVTLFPFTGQIFSHDHKRVTGCIHTFNQAAKINLTLPYAECGIRNPGDHPAETQYHMQIIVLFEQNDGTMTIQSFLAQCMHQKVQYRKQTIPKRIEEALEELQLVPTKIEQKAPIPECQMRIIKEYEHDHRNADDIAEVNVVDIGQPMLIEWRLVPESDAYGFHVRNCSVKDLVSGAEYLVIDEKGCSTDINIFGHPHYDTYHDIAKTHWHAFKVPDNNQLSIKCSFQICSDIADSTSGLTNCDAIPSPPFCPDLITSPSNSILFDSKKNFIGENRIHRTVQRHVHADICFGELHDLYCASEDYRGDRDRHLRKVTAEVSQRICISRLWMSVCTGLSAWTALLAIGIHGYCQARRKRRLLSTAMHQQTPNLLHTSLEMKEIRKKIMIH